MKRSRNKLALPYESHSYGCFIKPASICKENVKTWRDTVHSFLVSFLFGQVKVAADTKPVMEMHTHTDRHTHSHMHSHLWPIYDLLLGRRRKPGNSLQTIKPSSRLDRGPWSGYPMPTWYYCLIFIFPSLLVHCEKNNQNLFKGEGKTHCFREEDCRRAIPINCARFLIQVL